MARPALEVAAGILRDAGGRVLLARRPPGKPLAGLWEFPGGKLDEHEDAFAALARELREELGIIARAGRPLLTCSHELGDRRLRLHAWTVDDWSGEPQALEGQELAWHGVHALDNQPMPAPDWPIAAALRLPPRYAITPEPGADPDAFARRLDRLLAHGGQVVQLRTRSLDDVAHAAVATRAALAARRHGADLLLNDRAHLAARLGVGLHLPSARLRDWAQGAGDPQDGREAWLPRGSDGRIDVGAALEAGATAPARLRRQARGWLAASCHDADELRMAARIGCDFATLAPVALTASHPGATPLGWARAGALLANASLPVYALGGLGADDLPRAQAQGAFGVAAIRAFWPD
ncbi:thiamine phosphate synthase [Pseudofulvimonas gallinarii]|uniref:8-oxo-dGTP diphosphatase n=1 Tax=Pseudofulvimonas gallinarii TaxID=634155 RepID=A0A4S3KY14_9GAMM|nr:thiamine phosphate synthase [Pseudofulvimonas gallinarii]TCS93707.1 8-oxo-dGTPase [Pseudofulvimonas gallinarii]THD14249.1 hypothetical protein B1808_04320 [Pseudofulvimonas gallinarii]